MTPQLTDPTVSPPIPPSSSSAAPSSTPDPGTKIILVPPATIWASWTPGERNGVIAACTLAGIGLLALLIGVFWLTLKRRRWTKRHERGPVVPLGNSRRRSRSRIRELAASANGSGKGKGKSWLWGTGKKAAANKTRGIEGLENVELGAAAARALLGSGGYGLGFGAAGLGNSRAATAGGVTAGMAKGRGGDGYQMAVMRGGLQGVQRGSGVSGEEGWMRVLGSSERVDRAGGGAGVGRGNGRFQLGREVEGDRVRRGG